MNFKFQCFLSVIVCALLFSSCSEEDPCLTVECGVGTCVDGTCECPEGFSGDNCDVCEDFTKSILGDWNMTSPFSMGAISFNSDGTYVDDSEAILGYEDGDGNPGTIKTWTLEDQTLTFRVEVEESQGGGFATTYLQLQEFTCDQFTIAYDDPDFNFPIVFNRI